MSHFLDTYYPEKKNEEFYLRIYQKVYRPLFPRIKEIVDEFTRVCMEG